MISQTDRRAIYPSETAHQPTYRSSPTWLSVFLWCGLAGAAFGVYVLVLLALRGVTS